MVKQNTRSDLWDFASLAFEVTGLFFFLRGVLSLLDKAGYIHCTGAEKEWEGRVE